MTTFRPLAAFICVDARDNIFSVRIGRDARENISIVSKRICFVGATTFPKRRHAPATKISATQIWTRKFSTTRGLAGAVIWTHTARGGLAEPRRCSETRFSGWELWLARHARPWGKLNPKGGGCQRPAPGRGRMRIVLAGVILQVWQALNSDLAPLLAAGQDTSGPKVPPPP